MLVKWMDTLFAPKPLRHYGYTGRHRAARTLKPASAPAFAGSADILIK